MEPALAFSKVMKEIFGDAKIKDGYLPFEIGMAAAATCPEWAWGWLKCYRAKGEGPYMGLLTGAIERIVDLSPEPGQEKEQGEWTTSDTEGDTTRETTPTATPVIESF